jgi:hypothetical protein
VPTNEEGEFELILGNRQLLSVFFIVVILLGVFFTMGYIVGRNTAPSTPDIAAVRKPETKPLVVDSPARKQESAAEPSSSTPPAETAPQPTVTQPQQPETKPEPAKKETAKPEPPPKPAEKLVLPPASSPGQPAKGTYLQLAATSKREADIEVDILGKKGFKAQAAEIPEKPGTFRVLVGPLAETVLNKTRADLKAAGFPGDIAIRKTF